ncbi:hypothetical protein NPIL_478851 [Nephila pilipes]|uniref:Uncharacterized protein n=1 Tax=Nephila pilipes TaxID=299642 RepID=A0A8X6T6J2_NEPPI|nr:hypothetical protein NPIL_478851 [Nephila pilipes]
MRRIRNWAPILSPQVSNEPDLNRLQKNVGGFWKEIRLLFPEELVSIRVVQPSKLIDSSFHPPYPSRTLGVIKMGWRTELIGDRRCTLGENCCVDNLISSENTELHSVAQSMLFN